MDIMKNTRTHVREMSQIAMIAREFILSIANLFGDPKVTSSEELHDQVKAFTW